MTRRLHRAVMTAILVGATALVAAPSVADDVDSRVERLNELLKDVPTVVAERRGGTAVLTGWTRDKDDKKLVEKVVNVVGNVEDFTGDDLEEPSRMVEVDVVLVVVINTANSSIGHDFMKLVQVNFDYFNLFNDSEFGYKPGLGTSAPLGTTWGRLFTAKVDYAVNIANATDERVNIIARPHLTTLNGEKAEFLAGGEIVFKVSGVYSRGIQPYPYGINLTVTPTVLRTLDAEGRSQVLLDVDASRLTVLGVQTTATDDASFDKVQVKSNALLPINETLILSGLYQRENRSSDSGVPLVRRIPIVKYFFSNKTEVDQVLSTVIFITPRDPAILNEQSAKHLEAFIQRRHEYLKARDLGGQVIEDFKDKYHDWYKPQPNRYASHFFLRDNSLIYSELRGEDLRTDQIRRDIINVSSAD